MAGNHTLTQTKARVEEHFPNSEIDFDAMAVAANLFRAANTVRNHLERTVLSSAGLSWTAFVVLWVTWIWEPIETRKIAEESAVSKATLTGVLKTLENKGLLTRSRSVEDGRLVIVELTASGKALMESLFPQFNGAEVQLVSSLSTEEKQALAVFLRNLADN